MELWLILTITASIAIGYLTGFLYITHKINHQYTQNPLQPHCQNCQGTVIQLKNSNQQPLNEYACTTCGYLNSY